MTDSTRGRWQKGQSGNPAGRKVGQRHRLTVMLEKLMVCIANAKLRSRAGADDYEIPPSGKMYLARRDQACLAVARY